MQRDGGDKKGNEAIENSFHLKYTFLMKVQNAGIRMERLPYAEKDRFFMSMFERQHGFFKAKLPPQDRINGWYGHK